MCSLTFRSSIFSLWKWQNYFWEAQHTSQDLPVPEKTTEQTAEVVNIALKLVSNSTSFSLVNYYTLCVLQNGDIYGKLVTNYSLEIIHVPQLCDLHPHQCQVCQSQKHGNRNTILHPRRI